MCMIGIFITHVLHSCIGCPQPRNVCGMWCGFMALSPVCGMPCFMREDIYGVRAKSR